MINFLLFIAGIVLAGLGCWVYFSGRMSSLTERLRAREDDWQKSQQELQQMRERQEALRQDLGQAQAALAAEKGAGEQRLRLLQEAHERLSNEFKALSAEALRTNNAAFLELARQNLTTHQQKAESELTARHQAIDALVKPLKESLEKVDSKIQEIENARSSAYGKLGQQLEQLNHAQLRLQAEAAKLSTALRSTHYAGSWGELQLRRVVEMADMVPYCDFSEQETSGALRADLVIRLPAGQSIVVDAKAPVQSFREALESPDETVRAARLLEHAAKVRGHIDALGAKSYWEHFQPAPEFVVLFLPGDQLLSAALHGDPSLLERAVSKKVLLATPTTLIALLKAAAYGWRQEALSENAAEVSRCGRELYDRVSVFTDHLEKVGKGLEGALKGYNAAVGSLESSVLPSARRMAELGAKGTKTLGAPAGVETGVRELSRRT